MDLLLRLLAVWAALSVAVSLLLGLLIRRSDSSDSFTRLPMTAEPTDLAAHDAAHPAAVGVVIEMRR